MIAIVLAGGYAKRLWPLTLNKPKALLPIAGKPMIDHAIEKLIPLHPAIKRIIVSTNLRFQPQFRAWLETRTYHDLELIPNDSQSEEGKPSAIRALANIATKLSGEDILVVAGDNLFMDDLKDFLNFFNKKQATTIALYHAKKRR